MVPPDHRLRDALAELADAPPPPGLAAAAIRTARRHRRVRVVATGIAAVMVATVLLVVPVVVSSVGDDGTPAAAPAMEPMVVTGYSMGGEGSLLLDHHTGAYVEVPYRAVAPSPNGAYALVCAVATDPPEPARVGVLDTAHGEVRWVEDHACTGAGSLGGWSPDGEELLITRQNPDLAGGSGPPGFGIVDPQTLETRFVEHDDVDDPEINAMGNRYVWAPNGDEIALTQSFGTGGSAGDSVTAIRFYDLDGNLTRTVPATAPLTSEAGFSPDGTRMALQHPSPGEPIQVVDAATGEVHTVPVPPSLLVGWADDEHLIVRLELTLAA